MKVILFFLFAFLCLATYSQTPPPKQLRRFWQTIPSPANAIPYGANPKAGHYVPAGDAKIYYEAYGKGRPVVILHGGLFGSTYEMAPFIDSLSKNYQVIAVSTRGHGKSELGSAPLTYEQKANDVLAVIKAVTKDSVIVLGFSDGGYAGYKLASMYPARVKKLIAIGAGERFPAKLQLTSAKEVFSQDTAYWKQQLALMPEPQRFQEFLTRFSDFYAQVAVGKELFSTIKCPVLVMAGDRDQFISVQRVVNAAQMIPNSQLSIIPNCSHTVFLENFPAVWASVVPFLKQ